MDNDVFFAERSNTNDSDVFSTPKRPKVEEKIDPYKDTAQQSAWWQNLLAGAGGAMYGTYLGGKQLLGQASKQEIDDYKASMRGLNSTTAGAIGDVAGKVAVAVPTMFIPGSTTVLGAARVGSALGALEPVAEGEHRASNMALGAIGGAVGQGAANAIGRVVNPVRSTLSGVEADLATKARQFMPLNAAQETGSKPLRWIDSALDNMPFTAEAQAAQKLAQREAWQARVMQMAGEDASSAAPQYLGSAKDRISSVFSDLSARNKVVLDPEFQRTAAALKAQNEAAGPLGNARLDSTLEWLNGLATNKTAASPILGPTGAPLTNTVPALNLTGNLYQNARTEIGNAAQSAFSGGDAALGQRLKALRGALDAAADRSVSPVDSAAWTQAREQWKALKAIEKATDATNGQISPKKLINELARKNPNGVKYGKGDQEMTDLARIGSRFIADQLPDSGTAQRAWYMQMMQNPGAGLGGLLGFFTGGAPGALVGAAAGAATPVAMQRALWSDAGKKYLSDGLVRGKTIQRLAPYGNAAAVGGLLDATR